MVLHLALLSQKVVEFGHRLLSDTNRKCCPSIIIENPLTPSGLALSDTERSALIIYYKATLIGSHAATVTGQIQGHSYLKLIFYNI